MHPDNMVNKLDESISRFESLLDRMDGNNNPAKSKLLDEYEQALKDAISVLDATKQMFKSKQLKELRERLETVLAIKSK